MGMTVEDREQLVMNAMLTDVHINAAQRLLLQKFDHISGCQLSLLVQTNGFKPVSAQVDSMQIHHNGHQHWLASANIGGFVLLLDSAPSEELSTSLQQQLAAIYKELAVGGVLTVKRLKVQQQHGGKDCGLFSIAFLYSLGSGSSKFHGYDQMKMRAHLEFCISNEELLSFPLSKSRRAQQTCKEEVFQITLYCSCKMPECVDDMVQCDNCTEWFHFKCVQWSRRMRKQFVCVKCL